MCPMSSESQRIFRSWATCERLSSLKVMSFSEGNENWVKAPWFLEINPNGRIPAITHEGINVFETSAILEYLAQVFDKDRKFSFDPATHLKEWADQQSWTYFAVSRSSSSCI